VIWLSLAYVLFLFGAISAFQQRMIEGPLAYLVAVLPALPIVGVFVAIGRYLVEERDEYVRMLMVRQSLWASGFALSIATAWGFLENFELVGHVDAYYIAVLWFAGLGLGACINRFTLGSAAHC
jgi:hypothetical protein